MKASGDPNGRSITALSGLRKSKAKASKASCKMEKRGKKRALVCRDAKGRIVKSTSKKRAKR